MIDEANYKVDVNKNTLDWKTFHQGHHNFFNCPYNLQVHNFHIFFYFPSENNTKTILSTIFQKSSNGQQLLERVFTHMDILERDYFGLKYLDVNSVSQWLDPRKPIRKQSKDKGKLTQALILF